MNASQSTSVGPYVTVHAPEAPNAPTAHGILVADDTVLAPYPPRELMAAGTRLTAVIAPADGDHGEAESIEITQARLVCLADGKASAATAALTLAAPSALRRKVPLYSRAQLGDVLSRADGDLWAAFALLGYRVPDGDVRGPRDHEPWWADGDHVPAGLAGLAGIGALVSATLDEFAANTCELCHCCVPDPDPDAPERT